LIKIHTLLILYQLYSNFNNFCEEAKIICVFDYSFRSGVWGRILKFWQRRIFFRLWRFSSWSKPREQTEFGFGRFDDKKRTISMFILRNFEMFKSKFHFIENLLFSKIKKWYLPWQLKISTVKIGETVCSLFPTGC
jgi:hypothetical protein